MRIVTVNDYLVSVTRDWTFPFFHALGITVGDPLRHQPGDRGGDRPGDGAAALDFLGPDDPYWAEKVAETLKDVPVRRRLRLRAVRLRLPA